MIDSEAYRATLDRLQHDLVQAEAHAVNLRAAIVAIRGLIDTDTTTMAKSAKTSASAPHPQERDPRLANARMEDAAVIVLDKVRRPMRVRELYDTLMAMGFNYRKGFETFKGSMTPTLDRRPQFTKVDKGLYTLTELAHHNGATPQLIGTMS